jgi:hypothetical protein
MKVPSSMSERNAASQEEIDEAAVALFSAEMRAKLAASRAKGRDGWHDPALCPETRLAAMLIGHLPKGNPGNFLDLAILAMMLHERGADPALLKDPLARGDLAQPWRPISDAVKGGPAILALLRNDISTREGRPDLQVWDGLQVPLRHPGLQGEDGAEVRDFGWNVAAPVGHGGFPDEWIAGWIPLRGPEASLAWVQANRSRPASGREGSVMQTSATPMERDIDREIEKENDVKRDGWTRPSRKPKAYEVVDCLGADGREWHGLCWSPSRGEFIEPISNASVVPVVGEIVGWRYPEPEADPSPAP